MTTEAKHRRSWIAGSIVTGVVVLAVACETPAPQPADDVEQPSTTRHVLRPSHLQRLNLRSQDEGLPTLLSRPDFASWGEQPVAGAAQGPFMSGIAALRDTSGSTMFPIITSHDVYCRDSAGGYLLRSACSTRWFNAAGMYTRSGQSVRDGDIIERRPTTFRR